MPPTPKVNACFPEMFEMTDLKSCGLLTHAPSANESPMMRYFIFFLSQISSGLLNPKRSDLKKE